MILPWSVDVPQDRWPIVNYLLVAVIILVFLWELSIPADEMEERLAPYALDGLTLTGIFGHFWLHAGFLHIIGNLIFLWIFGNAVCAKIGNFKYLGIYIFIGVLTGLIQLMITGGPIIGASGAITGVVGMYLMYFWENDITCYWIWFPYIREFTLSSFWMILLWIFYDIVGALWGGEGIGYFAHLSGYGAGFGIAAILLKYKLVTMEDYERSLLDRWSEKKKRKTEDYEPANAFSRDIKYAESMEKMKQTTDYNPQPVQMRLPEKEPEPVQIRLPEKAPQPEMIRFYCSCGQRIKMPAKYAGRQGRCPRCKNLITVPKE